MMDLGLDLTDRQRSMCQRLMATVSTIDDYVKLHQKNTQHMPIEFNEQVFRAYVADYPNNSIRWQGLGNLDIDHSYYKTNIKTQDLAVRDYGITDRNAQILAGTMKHKDYDLSYYRDMMIERFDLIDAETRLHDQMPGDVHGFHYDSMTRYYSSHYVTGAAERANLPYNHRTMWADDGTIPVRLFLALDDWKYGQIWMFGNEPWYGWKTGDVMWFDWRYTPHCTANASTYERPILRVTARVAKGNPIYHMFD